jgi:hypothetical protein
MPEFDTSHQAGPDPTEKHKDLAVRKGTHDSGDGTKLYRSGAFDKNSGGDSATSHMADKDGPTK